MTHLKVQSAFARLEFSTLLQDVEELVQMIAQSKAQLATGKPPFAPDTYGSIERDDSAPAMEDAITSALIAMVASGTDPANFLLSWENTARRLPNRDAVERMLHMVKRILSADEVALPPLFQGNEPKLVRSVAALRMSRRSSLPIDAMVVSHASISAFVLKSQFRRDVEMLWAELVRAEWRRCIAVPALFRLLG